MRSIYLEKKIQTKDEALAELMAEYVAQKKSLGNSDRGLGSARYAGSMLRRCARYNRRKPCREQPPRRTRMHLRLRFRHGALLKKKCAISERRCSGVSCPSRSFESWRKVTLP